MACAAEETVRPERESVLVALRGTRARARIGSPSLIPPGARAACARFFSFEKRDAWGRRCCCCCCRRRHRRRRRRRLRGDFCWQCHL